MKNRLLLNSISTIKGGIKKSNINKIQFITTQIDTLKENIAKIKEIIDDNSKVHDFFENYNKSIFIIELLKNEKTELKMLM